MPANEGWHHVITAGCNYVLREGTYGSGPGASCWKGYSDSEINAMMVNSEMKVEFGGAGQTLYVKLVDWPQGRPRKWATRPRPNTAKWRWAESDSWQGPCGHGHQLNYQHWFFFKTPGRKGG